jgi:hypothetical protein
MSGLRRPSSVGPKLVNPVMESSFELMAPTEIVFFAVDGEAIVPKVPHGAPPWRSLPADSK